ncbi:hypothetical protein F5Y02DRAFT_372893 [Annulohypoxylon stygium]|nr:hypothetical protein F5Y02DRAFT_372893 [Annulohypoxylon stygium]
MLIIVWLAYHIIWQLIEARMRESIVAVPESYSIGILPVKRLGCGLEEGRSFAAYIVNSRFIYLHLCAPRNTRLRNVSSSNNCRHLPRKRAIWKSVDLLFHGWSLQNVVGWIQDVTKKRKPARII